MRRILIVDDQAEAFREAFELIFPDDELLLCTKGSTGLERAMEDPAPDVVLLDVRMPAEFGTHDEEEGLAVLARLQEEAPDLPVVLLSVISDVDTIVRGMRAGAFYYVAKPPEPKKLRHLLDTAIEYASRERERRSLKAVIDTRDRMDRPAAAPSPRDRLGTLIGSSPLMQRLYERIERVAASEARVLILGESGTGKELAAAEIHRLSPRAKKPFIVVNCPAIPENLRESELFGHTKGAFTGATSDHDGAFVRAHGGTIFLDEVGDMDLDLQAKVLRALEQQEIQPIGARKPTHVDVRVLAATNKDLRIEVAEGRFREDLYYRLNVVPLDMPPLRRHLEDVPAIAASLLAGTRGNDRLLTTEANAKLATHAWPGNVREMRNVLERAAALCVGTAIDAADIEIDAAPQARPPTDSNPIDRVFKAALDGTPPGLGLREFRDRHGEEQLRQLLVRALRWTSDVREAGRLLGFITRDDAKREYDNFRQWMRTLGVSRRGAMGEARM